MEGRTILLNSADYYYGITCSVWACFQDDSDEFMRLPQKNCSAFYGKDSYMHVFTRNQLQELLSLFFFFFFCSER